MVRFTTIVLNLYPLRWLFFTGFTCFCCASGELVSACLFNALREGDFVVDGICTFLNDSMILAQISAAARTICS